jgi:DNA-binding IclR family transcriptional regulator
LSVNQLQALATSDAPKRAQDETGNLVTNLEILGKEIRSNGFVVSHGEVIPNIVNIAVQARIRSSLKSELKARHLTIQRELDTQDKVLALITQELKTKLRLLQV